MKKLFLFLCIMLLVSSMTAQWLSVVGSGGNGISNLDFTHKSDSTIQASWNTTLSGDTKLFCTGGGVTNKPALDNSIVTTSTSHIAIVAGLLPSTVYSCYVTSGTHTSTPQNVTTNASPTRVLATSAVNGTITDALATYSVGDTHYSFISSDNHTYLQLNDVLGNYNIDFSQITNETSMTVGPSLLTQYGAVSTTDGSDGPSGAVMTNKSLGIVGMLGNLYMFVYRQFPPTYTSNRYANIIKSSDHGVTWNNFTALTTFVTGGNPVLPHSPAEPVQFYTNTVGLVIPVLYAADDGTLGYNISGNQIDGANAYIYCSFWVDGTGYPPYNQDGPYMMRIPRIDVSRQDVSRATYWIGPSSPSSSDWVNDIYWSATPSGMTQTFDAITYQPSFWHNITFIPGLNSYILTQAKYTAGTSSSWQFFSAPTPAGPWQLFYTQSNPLPLRHWSPAFPFHRDVIANSAISDIPLRILYSGDPLTPFTYYGVNYSTLTLNPTAGGTMTQLANDGFIRGSYPVNLGGGDGWTTAPTYSAMQVISAGIAEGTALGVNDLDYWSDPVPAGDVGGTWPANQYSECVFKSIVLFSGNTQYCIVRQSSSDATEYLLTLKTNTQTLYAFVSGTPNSLVTFNESLANNDVVRLVVINNVLTFTHNGVVVGSPFTDTNNYVTSGSPGMGVSATGSLSNAQYSLWSGGAFQAVAPSFIPIGGSGNTFPLTVTINCTGTAYYTTNGATPTHSSSTVSCGSTVSISSAGITLKARTATTNFADSGVFAQTYN